MRRGRPRPRRRPPIDLRPPLRRRPRNPLPCKECGELIEPRILRRIISARRRGRMVPMVCKSCFLQKRPKVSKKAEPDLKKSLPPDLRVEEWSCPHCNAALEPEEVISIKDDKTLECEYCSATLSRELYM